MTVSGYAGINQATKVLLRAAPSEASAHPAAAHEAPFYKIVRREITIIKYLRVKAGVTIHFDKLQLLTIVDIIMGQTVSLLIMK